MSSNNKKVCIIAPSLTMGGMERASVNIANEFDNQSVNVLYIALFKHPHFFKLNNGITFYEPKGFNHITLSLFKTLRWVRKTIRKEAPDSILVYNKFYGALVSLALLATKFKIVISERSSPLYNWPKKIRVINWLAYFLNPPKGVMAQTTIAASYQNNYFRSKRTTIQVIPNLLREVELYPHIQRKKIIIAVGRLNEFNKGFDRLIEAFAKVENKSWRLQLVGTTSNINNLRTQVKYLGIEGRVDFVKPTVSIDRVFATASIFVIPSRSEGFPNALCEAMAAGLPCISFDFMAGPRDIIRDKIDGYIINDGDIEALTEKLNELIADEKEQVRVGENALEIRERYNQEKISKLVLDFISN